MALITSTVGQRTLFGSCHRLKRRTQTGNKLVTEGTLGVRRSRGFGVPDPERRSVVKGSFRQRVISRLATCRDLSVANRTLAYAVVAASTSGLVAHRAVPHRRYA